MSNHRPLARLFIVAALYATAGMAAAPLDDPMRPPSAELVSGARGKATAGGTQRTERDAYQLSAVRIAQESRSATINGRSVTVGERIGAARVESIQSGSVTLQQAGRRFTISLLPISIKKPVEAKQP